MTFSSPAPRRPSLVGDAIRAARGGETLHEFSSTTGISHSTLWRYERGLRVPKRIREIDALEAAGVDRFILVEAARASFGIAAGATA